MSHANRLLSWQDTLGEDEFPPDWMLPFDDQLVDWFDQVTRRRKEKYSGGDSDDEPEDMMKNELAEGRR